MNNLAELKAIDIKYLIENETGLRFTKNGGITLEKCPFCGSGTGKKGTPGFNIKPGTNIFNCFACGKKGNPIEFIQYFKGFQTKKAIQFLQKQYLNAPKAQEPGNNKTSDITSIINAIKKNPIEKATDYLQSRGIKTNAFQDAWYYDSYKNAVCFLDTENNLLNRRGINNKEKGNAKGSVIKNAIYDKNYRGELETIYLCESPIDSLSLAGYSAISIFSTSNRFIDKEKLKKYVSGKKVILAFDPDLAGDYCTNFYHNLLTDPFFEAIEIKVLILPEGKDINDLCQAKILENHINDPGNYKLLTLETDTFQDSFFNQRKERHPKAKDYIRVGTSFYLKGKTVSSKGENIPELFLWKIGTIRQDFGGVSGFLDMIPKYISFVNVPNNTNRYRREIKGCYNLYETLKYQPIKGSISKTMGFLSHIFSNNIDVGLDYLSLLYKNPNQNLPVLCLVSKKQKTGKSTFLKWLCDIYGANAIILGNEDFQGKFNSHYASKLVIGIDEGFIDKKLIKEKIKRLSTDNRINLEAKGRDIIRMDFFGKFILCTNNEDSFIQMDVEDNRFFVLKLNVIQEQKENPFLLDELRVEIPAFLHFISIRKLVYPHKSRLWFSPNVYETEALKKVVKSSRTWTEKAMLNWFSDIFEYNEVGGKISITPKILAEQLKNELRNINNLRNEVEKIFRDEWGLNNIRTNSRFQYPRIGEVGKVNEQGTEQIIIWNNANGKYYEVRKEFIEEKNR